MWAYTAACGSSVRAVQRRFSCPRQAASFRAGHGSAQALVSATGSRLLVSALDKLEPGLSKRAVGGCAMLLTAPTSRWP